MNSWKNIWLWFLRQNQQQKIIICIALSLIISFIFFMIIYFIKPNYGVLFNNLKPEDAQEIIVKLDKSSINYRIENSGRDILIDKALIDKTRLNLMDNGLLLTGSLGFELFDKSDFGMTEFTQQINYLRALQGELERTINSLNEVKSSRVHLVISEHHLFQQDENQPKAVVTLQLKNPLKSQQVKTIQRLVASAVPQLKELNVTVVDQEGNSLVNSEEENLYKQLNEKKYIENYLAQKIMQLLQHIFPNQKVLVKIDVKINYDELKRESIKPNQAGAVEHEKEIKHAISSKKNDKNPFTQDVTQERNYQLGSEKVLFAQANGRIERLTISVILPEKTPSSKLLQVERIVKSAVGFDYERGDSIAVEAIIEAAPKKIAGFKLTKDKSLSFYQQYRFIFLTALVVFLLIIYRINQRQRRTYFLNQIQHLLNYE